MVTVLQKLEAFSEALWKMYQLLVCTLQKSLPTSIPSGRMASFLTTSKKETQPPHDKFRKNASTKDFSESNTDQPWIPTVHPSSTKRLPLAILPTKLCVDPSILTPEAPKMGSILL